MKITFDQYEQLKQRGLSHEDIAAAAQVRGMELPSESLAGSLIKPLVKAGVRTGQAIAALGAKALGVDDGRIADAVQKDQVIKTGVFGDIKIEGQKPIGAGGGKQIGADVLENAAFLAPYGRMAKGLTTAASKVLPQGVSRAAGFIGASAAGGYAMDAAGTLRGERDTFAPGIGTAIGVGIPGAGYLAQGAGKVAKFAATQMTGLNKETVEVLLTNPRALTEAQKAGLDRANLANQVQSTLTKRLENLSHTGKGYDAIRRSATKVTLTDDIPSNVLKKYGVDIDGGVIKVGPESTPLKPGDRKALEDFIAQYGNVKELSANGLLNVRKALDNMASWGQDKSDISAKIAREMRKSYDTIAKNKIPGLAELDVRYGPERQLLGKLKKDLLTPEGQLKDTAISRIANIANKGKEKSLERLEKLVPGIGQKAQILKAIEDIGATEGQKVGTYLRAGNLMVGGAATFAGGPLVGVVAAVASTPMIAVPIIKTVGRTRGWADDTVTRLVGKLTTGKTLTGAELVMFRAAMGEHIYKLSPGDQLLDSNLAKKSDAFLDARVPKNAQTTPATPKAQSLESNSSSATVPQPARQATDLSTATRQGVQKSSSSPKSTVRKVLDAILPGDTPNKQGGFVINPFNKEKIKAIDLQSKDELRTIQQYLQWSKENGKLIRKYEDLFALYAEKYGINRNGSAQEQIKRIDTILKKTKTIDALPGTRKQ